MIDVFPSMSLDCQGLQISTALKEKWLMFLTQEIYGGEDRKFGCPIA